MLIGEASNDYDVSQKKEQLTQVETRLYQLLAQVKQIANEQVSWRSHWCAYLILSGLGSPLGWRGFSAVPSLPLVT